MHGTAKVIERVAPGAVLLDYEERLSVYGGRALWTLVTLRKSAKCAVSGIELPKGSKAYRPVGNQMYRGRRIAPTIIEDGDG